MTGDEALREIRELSAIIVTRDARIADLEAELGALKSRFRYYNDVAEGHSLELEQTKQAWQEERTELSAKLAAAEAEVKRLQELFDEEVRLTRNALDWHVRTEKDLRAKLAAADGKAEHYRVNWQSEASVSAGLEAECNRWVEKLKEAELVLHAVRDKADTALAKVKGRGQ